MCGGINYVCSSHHKSHTISREKAWLREAASAACCTQYAVVLSLVTAKPQVRMEDSRIVTYSYIIMCMDDLTILSECTNNALYMIERIIVL